MRQPDLQQFQQHLVRSGILPRHARRLAAELSDHYDDLEEEARGSGLAPAAAARVAGDRLGDLEALARTVASHRELHCWPRRYPRLARVVLPLAWLVSLPAAPLFAGAANAMVLARWGACLLLGGVVTCGLLLAMQFSITL